MCKTALKLFLISFLLGFISSACTSSGGLEDPGFRQRIKPAQSAVPIPVEIAKDIERITEDGLLIYNDSPSYSNAIGTLQNAIHQASSDPINFDNEEARQSYELARQSYEFAKEKYELAKRGNRSLSNSNTKQSQAINGNQGESESYLTEDDMLIKSEGPLGQSLIRKKQGPLSFKSNIRGTASGSGQKGETISYIVKLGDTLMKIAFEKYANYLKWKDIYRLNKGKIKKPELMQVGTELTIKNVKYIYIKRDGKPYLIKKMDTLKSISQKLYGTPNKWKDIWENNPQLIKNPKKIYTGFTLYYPIKNKPDVVKTRLPSADLKTELPEKNQ